MIKKEYDISKFLETQSKFHDTFLKYQVTSID